MSYVVAIDVGIKNMGVCIFDFRCGKVVLWDNVTLAASGRYIPAQNVQYVREFVQTYNHYFQNMFQLVIERQMRCNMRIVESVLQAMFYDRCVVVSPRAVKVHYGLSMRNYRLNKQKAVSWVKGFMGANAHVFTDTSSFTKAAKQDDLADSLILLLYYLDTYSNQLTVDVPSFGDVEL